MQFAFIKRLSKDADFQDYILRRLYLSAVSLFWSEYTCNMTLFIVYLSLLFLSGAIGIIPDICWRDYRGNIPEDAFRDDSGLYIGQIPQNGILPASIYKIRNAAVTEVNGHKVEMKNGLKILCTKHPEHLFWERVHIDYVVKENFGNLVIGGYETGQDLFVGKVFHQGQWKIGKVFPFRHKYEGLRIWNDAGNLEIIKNFDILMFTKDLPM